MIRPTVCTFLLAVFATAGSRADETRAKVFADTVLVKPVLAGEMRFSGQALDVRTSDQSADFSLYVARQVSEKSRNQPNRRPTVRRYKRRKP